MDGLNRGIWRRRLSMHEKDKATFTKKRGVLGQSRCGTGNFGSRPRAVENVEFVDEGDGSSASRPPNLIVDGSFGLSFSLITTEAPDNEPPDDVAFDAAETPASATLGVDLKYIRRDILSNGSWRGSSSMAWGGPLCERKHATIYIADWMYTTKQSLSNSVTNEPLNN
eukprot:scaffold124473_cov54-Cyclotella_meneghiniana.AAC.1